MKPPPNPYCWRNPANQLILVNIPIISKDFIHVRWLFGISEPSTVSFPHLSLPPNCPATSAVCPVLITHSDLAVLPNRLKVSWIPVHHHHHHHHHHEAYADGHFALTNLTESPRISAPFGWQWHIAILQRPQVLGERRDCRWCWVLLNDVWLILIHVNQFFCGRKLMQSTCFTQFPKTPHMVWQLVGGIEDRHDLAFYDKSVTCESTHVHMTLDTGCIYIHVHLHLQAIQIPINMYVYIYIPVHVQYRDIIIFISSLLSFYHEVHHYANINIQSIHCIFTVYMSFQESQVGQESFHFNIQDNSLASKASVP